MGYHTGEALLLAAIQEHVTWMPENTDRADWRKLNSGKSAYYVILRPGTAAFSTDSIGGLGTIKRKRVRTWRTEVLVYHRYIDDGASAETLQQLVSTLAAHLEQYPKLGDTSGVTRWRPSAPNQCMTMPPATGASMPNTQFSIQSMICESFICCPQSARSPAPTR